MKRTPGKTVEARERFWTRHIEAARRHPKGVTEYLRGHGLSKPNYYSWFRRLRENHPEWEDLANQPEIEQSQVRSEKNKTNGKLPETEVVVRARRRKFSMDQKTQILAETDNAAPEVLAAVLRREGIHVHTINKWRTERDLIAIASKKRGPKIHYHAAENKILREENKRLHKKLEQANDIINLQKKISEMLGIALQAEDH